MAPVLASAEWDKSIFPFFLHSLKLLPLPATKTGANLLMGDPCTTLALCAAGFDIASPQGQHVGMTVVLDKELETLIGRLVASRRFHTPHDAVGAGLRKLEGEEGIPSAFEDFPEGSLARFYTPENNSEELELFKACSMAVEDE